MATKAQKLVTILVIYTNKKIEDNTEIGRFKKYSFNTSDNIKVGDMIKTKHYDTNLQVVKVMTQSFKYFNRSTGELSNKFNSSSQWDIRELKIRDEQTDVVYGQLIK